MVSLEELTLVTGRYIEAGYILRTFAHYVGDGLIPNMFPEGEQQGLYHTADATLWYFHAIERYLAATGDRDTLELLLPKLVDIIEHHIRGTRFGIGLDPTDGLLKQGEEGYQLTWMDAKVGDWVVTPRRGKTVEINALWYNALRLMESWIRQTSGDTEAAKYADLASRCYDSFNNRFWYDAGGYLYDVIDGESGADASLRPNQLFAISLSNPVLEPLRWKHVLDVVQQYLVTPHGLRSLAHNHRDYKAQYYGDLSSRDAAYHQGTVWARLIGPFIDTWLRVSVAGMGENGAKFWEGTTVLKRFLPQRGQKYLPEFCHAASCVRIFRRSSISSPSSSRRYSARLFRASSKISASSLSIWRITSSIMRAIFVSKLRSEGFRPFNS